jgi:hypothetical protein
VSAASAAAASASPWLKAPGGLVVKVQHAVASVILDRQPPRLGAFQ